MTCFLWFHNWTVQRVDGTLFRRCSKCCQVERFSAYFGEWDEAPTRKRGYS